VPPLPAPTVRSRALRWAALGTFLFLAMGLLLLLMGEQSGLAGLILGILMAVLPVPIYIALALWLDRMEPEPPQLLALAFGWGATIAVLLAIIFQLVTGGVVGAILGESAAKTYGTIVAAPFSEEIAKGLFLFLLFFLRKDEFDGIVDGIIYATMTALGFAMVENIGYYGDELRNGVGAVALTGIVRGIFSPFAHPLFTSMTGIGLGWARQSDNPMVKTFAPVTGLGLAMFLHFTWNYSARSGSNLIGTYFTFMVPVFFGVLLLVYLSLRREQAILREKLGPEVQSGLLTPEELALLCTVTGRALLRTAAQRGGKEARDACNRFQQTLSELAFHRSRVERGIVPADAAAELLESAYEQHLQELRRRCRM
jgi:RsiW-degrading membrane proteinase PrsW (M82 family)